MTSLLVRGLDEALVQSLKQRAAANGRSAEAEHRAILKESLQRPPRRSLADVLASMPNVGLDEDFERQQEGGATRDVFG
ncbi:MAG: DNA-binding protein [Lautropia sp.]|nr:DNA-binding protein [Lautropia sp.]